MSASRSQPSSRDFPGTIEAAAEAEAWLMSQSTALGLAADTEFAINLCLEELFINAVKHGRAHRATVSIWTESDGVRVEFVDDGGPFDPSRRARQATSAGRPRISKSAASARDSCRNLLGA